METQNAVATAPPSLWSSIREAVRGSHQDYTTGSLNRAICCWRFQWFWNGAESLFAVVDVSGLAGWEQTPLPPWTDGIALEPVFAVGLGLSLSTTAMVARRIGEKIQAERAVAGVQAIILGLGVSLAIGLPCFFLRRDCCSLWAHRRRVVTVGSLCANRAGRKRRNSDAVSEQRYLRGAGDAAIAMRLLWCQTSSTWCLIPALIFGWGPFPKLGVTGAALATSTGRSIESAISFTGCCVVLNAFESCASTFESTSLCFCAWYEFH
jgi:hypothetical protein